MKEAVVFTFSLLWHILVHILGPRKDKAHPIFVSRWGISNEMCDMELKLL